jgi:hypothetical protein
MPAQDLGEADGSGSGTVGSRIHAAVQIAVSSSEAQRLAARSTSSSSLTMSPAAISELSSSD